MELDIYQFNNVTDCIIAIEKLQNRKNELMRQEWKQRYEKKCGDSFFDLESILFSLNFSAKDRNITYEAEVSLCQQVSEAFYKKGQPTISALTEILDELGLNISDGYTSKMICNACICKGCTSCLWVEKYNETGESPDETIFTKKEINEAKHCNGYSCMQCKQNSFKGYDWVCEE